MAEGDGAEVVRPAKRQYWREAEARVVVEAWRQSGKSAEAFAREHGVHAERLRRWAARLEAAGSPVLTFYPVRLRAEGERAEPLELEVVLRDGRAVRVPYGFAPDHLQRLLQVLEAGV